MVSTTDYENAIATIDVNFLQKLYGWLEGESINLDHYLANPQGHVEYSPFVIIDTAGLQARSAMLKQSASDLQNLIALRENPNATMTQMVAYINNMPHEVFPRLANWLERGLGAMESTANLPLPDYASYISFDVNKFEATVQDYQTGYQCVTNIINYKIENNMP